MSKKISTQQQIIQYLENYFSGTTAELAAWLGVTKADITYHLRIMYKKGIIESDVRRTIRAGRPERINKLSAFIQKNNYQNLCRTLISRYIKNADDPENEYDLIGSSLLEGQEFPGLITNRLNRLVKYLNYYGYQSSWVAHRKGPQIILKACPYRSLVSMFPGLCLMDLSLISTATKQKFKQVEKINYQSKKQTACCFEIIMD